MVRLAGPLMSLEARGTIGTSLTFSHRKSGPQVRWQRKQRDRITSARTAARDIFRLSSFAASHFFAGDAQTGAAICGTDKQSAIARAASHMLTWYNLLLKENSAFF